MTVPTMAAGRLHITTPTIAMEGCTIGEGGITQGVTIIMAIITMVATGMGGTTTMEVTMAGATQAEPMFMPVMLEADITNHRNQEGFPGVRCYRPVPPGLTIIKAPEQLDEQTTNAQA